MDREYFDDLVGGEAGYEVTCTYFFRAIFMQINFINLWF